MENEPLRRVDPQAYLPQMVEILDVGRQLLIPVSGNSMMPFLCAGRDYVLLESVKFHPVKRGDIVLFQRETGQFVLHRVWSADRDSYKMIGDGQEFIEGPIGAQQLRAVAVGIKRKGTWLRKGSCWNLFFRWIWLRVVPYRTRILRCYSRLRGRIR